MHEVAETVPESTQVKFPLFAFIFKKALVAPGAFIALGVLIVPLAVKSEQIVTAVGVLFVTAKRPPIVKLPVTDVFLRDAIL